MQPFLTVTCGVGGCDINVVSQDEIETVQVSSSSRQMEPAEYQIQRWCERQNKTSGEGGWKGEIWSEGRV